MTAAATLLGYAPIAPATPALSEDSIVPFRNPRSEWPRNLVDRFSNPQTSSLADRFWPYLLRRVQPLGLKVTILQLVTAVTTAAKEFLRQQPGYAAELNEKTDYLYGALTSNGHVDLACTTLHRRMM